MSERHEEGRVIRIAARVWTVDVAGTEVACALRPGLFDEHPDQKNPVAVGDRVLLQIAGERGVIEQILPRRNRIARPSPRDHGRLQVTAANVDQLVSVSAAQDPPLRRGLIDRFQVAAEREGMELLIVVNKCDAGAPPQLVAELALYERMGYPVLFTSALHGLGVAALADALRDRTSLMIGHSGVGKSSLLNSIDPRLAVRTASVAKHGRGRHTTTSVSLWRLPQGGYLVDSPGIRGFGLSGIPAAELAILMPDLRPLTGACRFPDCTHEHEPHCAVRAALARGEVDAVRYDSYLRMLHDIQGVAVDDDED